MKFNLKPRIVVLLLLLLSLVLIGFYREKIINSFQIVSLKKPQPKTEIVFGGTPKPLSYPNKPVLLKNAAFWLEYDLKRKNPAWVAYQLVDIPEVQRYQLERPDNFEADKRIKGGSLPGDYTRSGYTRGHLAPNHAISTLFGPKAQAETFLMSNIIPQKSSHNSGIWRKLEELEFEDFLEKKQQLWIITGPIYNPQIPDHFLPAKIEVPDSLYKILLDQHEQTGKLEAIAFIIPQTAKSEDSLKNYLVSIDEIERQSGFDFFSELPDEEESTLERNRARKLW